MDGDPTQGAIISVEGPAASDQIMLAALAGQLRSARPGRPLPSQCEVERVAHSLLHEGADLVLAVGDGSASTAAAFEDLSARCRRARVDCRFLELDLDGIIGETFQDSWLRVADEIRARVLGGGRIGIVSMGFLGAAETLAAQLLVETGLSGCEALSRVDAAVRTVLSGLPARRRRLLGLDPWQRDHVLARRPGA